MRFWITAFALAAIALSIPMLTATAGAEGIAGNWKVVIYEDGKYLNFWLLKLQDKDGKLVGEAETLSKIPATTIPSIAANGDLLTLQLKLANGVAFNFEGKLPKAGGKKILGSITRAGNSTPCYLEATQAKNAFDVNLDVLTRTPTDPKVFATVLSLIGQAKEKKIPEKDVAEWVDGVVKTADAYGPTWAAEFGIRIVEELAADYPALAVRTATKLEKAFDPKTPIESKVRLLGVLADAYKAAGQPEEAAKVDRRAFEVEKIEFEESEKSALNFKTEPYVGKVSQPVLVELFTGAQCPPCIAADKGFDGLEKAFKESDVVLLQYHLHVPDSDALTNPDNEARADYYARSLRGTPAIYFNGKPMAPGGGGHDEAGEKYLEYRGIVEKLITKEPGGKVSVTANRKGDVITIDAKATTDVKGAKLRVALVEDWARYRGRNGLVFHQRIVRAMPGGPAGFAVDKSLEKQITVDLNELRAKLNKYLDNHGRNEPFPDGQRPMRLHDLHVAVFLQDDETNNVLAAASVPVKE